MPNVISPLSPIKALALFQKYRQSHVLQRGRLKKTTLKAPYTNAAVLFVSLLVAGLGTLLVALGQVVFTLDTLLSPELLTKIPLPFVGPLLVLDNELPVLFFLGCLWKGLQAGGLLLGLFWLWPWGKLLHVLLRDGTCPTRSVFTASPRLHQGVALTTGGLVLAILCWQAPFLAWWHIWVPTRPVPLEHVVWAWPVVPSTLWHAVLGAWALGTACLIVLVFDILPRTPGEPFPWKAKTKNKARGDDFSLYLGKSTGKLTKRYHEAGIAPEQRVCLSSKDAALNILILGGIGEGKTTALIHGLLLQCLDQDCGGLIFDIKGSFHQAVDEIAKAVGKTDITVIGPGKQSVNLLAGLSPESAADMIRSLFLMTGGHQKDSFWVTQAGNLCRGALGLLSFLPTQYHLAALRRFVFEADFREEIECSLSQRTLSEREQALLASYRDSLALFEACHEKVQADIRATASATLSQFTHPDIVESFCAPTDDALPLERVVDGAVFLVDIPKAKYGQVARVVQALIKIRWFLVMEARCQHPAWNQDRVVFMLCDEYQSLVTADASDGAISDLSFWDKARESKSVGIVSAQSIASFYSALGNRDLADSILQNFRQRLCFKTEDEKTLSHLQRLVGDVMVPHRSTSRTRGRSRGKGSQRTRSTSDSLTHIRQPIVDGQLMRVLAPNQALALLTLQQQAMDDVLDLQPVWLQGDR